MTPPPPSLSEASLNNLANSSDPAVLGSVAGLLKEKLLLYVMVGFSFFFPDFVVTSTTP